MKLEMFSVFDSKAAAFLPPFVLPNRAMAERSFADCVNDSSHAFSRNLGDYALYSVGSFDDRTAVLSPTIPPDCCGYAASFYRLKLTEEDNKSDPFTNDMG